MSLTQVIGVAALKVTCEKRGRILYCVLSEKRKEKLCL